MMSSDTRRAPRRRDETCICDNCTVSFLWTIEEQHQDETGDAPLYCPGCRRLAAMPTRERGIVKWYNGRKHYGFIVRQKADEIFTHRSQLAERGRLREGDLVEFTVAEGDKGVMAADVVILARGEESA